MGWGFFCVRLTLGGRDWGRKEKRLRREKTVSLLSYTPYSPSTAVVTCPLNQT